MHNDFVFLICFVDEDNEFDEFMSQQLGNPKSCVEFDITGEFSTADGDARQLGIPHHYVEENIDQTFHEMKPIQQNHAESSFDDDRDESDNDLSDGLLDDLSELPNPTENDLGK